MALAARRADRAAPVQHAHREPVRRARAARLRSAGLYGVMAYLVTQRTREIGVRLALGAPPARVMTTVIGRGVVHTAAGVAIGIAAAWQLASLVQSFLFEVRPHDPVVYGCRRCGARRLRRHRGVRARPACRPHRPGDRASGRVIPSEQESASREASPACGLLRVSLISCEATRPHRPAVPAESAHRPTRGGEDQQKRRAGERWRIKRIDLEQHPPDEPCRHKCADEASGCANTRQARGFGQDEIANIGAGGAQRNSNSDLSVALANECSHDRVQSDRCQQQRRDCKDPDQPHVEPWSCEWFVQQPAERYNPDDLHGWIDGANVLSGQRGDQRSAVLYCARRASARY